MSFFHNKTTLSVDSQFLTRKDPVTRLPFNIGATVFVCEKNNEAILATSVVVSNNRCPFCGEEIYQAYTNESKPVYPSSLPWNHNALGLGESILFSFLIGGCGGGLISALSLPDSTLKYLIQIILICSVMVISLLVTKQPLGASLAVLWLNLTPVFINGVSIDLGGILFILVLTCIAWFVSASISKIIE